MEAERTKLVVLVNRVFHSGCACCSSKIYSVNGEVYPVKGWVTVREGELVILEELNGRWKVVNDDIA